MDYVLFGMGYGASLMLIGWALRTFGPALKYANANDSDDIDTQVKRRFWVRFIQGLGGVVAISGIALVFITFVVMLVNPTDGDGAVLSYVVWGFTVIALLAWCWMYFGRFGLTGVWSREEGYGLRGTNGQPARDHRTRRVPQPKEAAVLPRASDEPVAEEVPVEAHDVSDASELVPDYDFGDTEVALNSRISSPAEKDNPEPEGESEKPYTPTISEESEPR